MANNTPKTASLQGYGNKNTSHLSPAQTARDENPHLSVADVTQDNRWLFLDETQTDGTRWNKSYPYQLMMMERVNGGWSVWHTFTLPIPPQEMSISTPFAINTSITLGGVIEEHNGTPIRMISFSGTTGVAPLRGSTDTKSDLNTLPTVFGGTVRAFQDLVSTATMAATRQQTSNLMEETDENLKGTGYYQFRLLQRFLETYAAAKKKSPDLRLAVAIWKDASVYLVTPVAFDVRRSASSPWEYSYSLNFKAWRRTTLQPSFIQGNLSADPRQDTKVLAEVFSAIQDARKVLNRSQDLLLAASTDARNAVLEPLRSAALFCGDAIGAAMTAADLPGSIARTLKKAVAEVKGIQSVVRNGGSNLDKEFRRSLEEWATINGRPETGVADPQNSLDAETADPANKALENPEDNPEEMEAIRPSELNLPPTVLAAIEAERERVREMERLDFETMRDNLVEFQAILADTVGAGSEEYNAIYGRTAAIQKKTTSEADFEALYALNSAITQLNRLAASGNINQEVTTTMEVMAGMASASGIAFQVPVSKIPVPFPYGSTLEHLALQYLGTPDRWHEIAALNGLRAPYVDEIGFSMFLLTCGKGNEVMVGNSDNLRMGQTVWISSSNAPRTKRRILNIDRRNPNGIVLTLDGDPDMEQYDTHAQAKLETFLPDTVNSQMMLYIPSDIEVEEEDWRTKSIPGVNEYDQIIAAGGVDLLLTQDGDLAITPDGDCKLALGVANIIQRIRTAMATPRGALLHHPEYGLGVYPGISTADADAKEVKAQLEAMFRSDPAFAGVSDVLIQKSGPTLRISMSISIAGASQIIPVTVDIRR